MTGRPLFQDSGRGNARGIAARGPRPVRKGFTLVEMVVVITVIALLATLTIPSVNKVLRASNLSAGGRQLVDQFNLARQTAQSKNVAVQVRLYKLPDYNAAAAAPSVYRAFQLFMIGDSTAPMGKPEFFRNPVVVSAGTNESAFLGSETDTDPAPADPKLGVYGLNYKYVAFNFLPSGATDLAAGKNFVTLVLEGEKGVAEGGNFFTVQVDTVNGSIRSFRP